MNSQVKPYKSPTLNSTYPVTLQNCPDFLKQKLNMLLREKYRFGVHINSLINDNVVPNLDKTGQNKAVS